MASCYSEYVSLSYSVHHYPCHNDAHSKVAFVVSKCAYLPARGIARFPDGGIPRYLVEETSLYVLEPESKQVRKIKDFTDLSNFLGCNRSSWKTYLAYTDSLVYCSVSPVSDWKFYRKMAKTAQDSQRIKNLEEKYNQPFVFHEKTKEIAHVDTSVFNAVYKKEKKADFTQFMNHLSEIPLAELGLVIQDIYPKSDKEYIKETIFLENKSSLTRRAVIEQIISKLSKKQIKKLLRQMDEYKNSLDGYEKTRYESNSKEVYRRIEALL